MEKNYLRRTILCIVAARRAAVLRRTFGWASAGLIGLAVMMASGCKAEPIRPAIWVGGTVSGLASGTTGQIEIASPEQLVFRPDSGAAVAILYSAVQSFSYRRQVSHHLGVLPAIAVGLIATRQHRHMITIGYTDPATQAKQTVVLELRRDGAALLLSVLRERTSVCAPNVRQACGGTVE